MNRIFGVGSLTLRRQNGELKDVVLAIWLSIFGWGVIRPNGLLYGEGALPQVQAAFSLIILGINRRLFVSIDSVDQGSLRTIVRHWRGPIQVALTQLAWFTLCSISSVKKLARSRVIFSLG